MDNLALVDDNALELLVLSDRHLDRVRSLLAGGEDPNQKVYGSNTLLHVAAQSESPNYRIVQELLNAGADVNSTNRFGFTPLHFAVMRRKHEVVDELIGSGALINTKNLQGRTALHYAVSSTVERFYSDTVPDIWIMQKLLAQKDTDVNPVDIIGETPLMWAVMEHQFTATAILLYKGANASIPNIDLESPLHMALSSSIVNEFIICVLFVYGASIYNKNKRGISPLDILVQMIEGEGLSYTVKVCVKFIVLKYHLSKDLKLKLGKNPEVRHYLEKCCIEVQRMQRQIIYGNITVHDFLFDCFQARSVSNVVRDIYKPVVEILLTGIYDEIIHRMSRYDLFDVLEILQPRGHYFSYWVFNYLVSPYITHYETFRIIASRYESMNVWRLWNTNVQF